MEEVPDRRLSNDFTGDFGTTNDNEIAIKNNKNKNKKSVDTKSVLLNYRKIIQKVIRGCVERRKRFIDKDLSRGRVCNFFFRPTPPFIAAAAALMDLD